MRIQTTCALLSVNDFNWAVPLTSFLERCALEANSPRVHHTLDTRNSRGVTSGQQCRLFTTPPQSQLLSSQTTRVSKIVTPTTIPVKLFCMTTFARSVPLLGRGSVSNVRGWRARSEWQKACSRQSCCEEECQYMLCRSFFRWQHGARTRNPPRSHHSVRFRETFIGDLPLSSMLVIGAAVRADSNGSGTVSVPDVITMARRFFSEATGTCDDADDVNDDGGLTSQTSLICSRTSSRAATRPPLHTPVVGLIPPVTGSAARNTRAGASYRLRKREES